jgi:membrane protease YdiL (CAAX protease family)
MVRGLAPVHHRVARRAADERRLQLMAERAALPALATLALALGGPPAIAVAARRGIGDSTSVAAALPFDLLLWGLFAAVLASVIRVERKPLASIGFKTPGWSTVVWSLLLLLGINFMLAPAVMWAAANAGIAGYEAGLTPLLALPAWYRVFLAVSAGVIEETLYRGYAVERLALLTGSYWSSGAIAVLVFGVAHIPFWGIGPALVSLAAGAAATFFYVWKRDLPALIVAHAVGDTLGLVVVPPVGTGS